MPGPALPQYPAGFGIESKNVVVAGVELLQRGVPLVGQIAAVGDPVLADRALQQLVDFGIGRPSHAHSRE